MGLLLCLLAHTQDHCVGEVASHQKEKSILDLGPLGSESAHEPLPLPALPGTQLLAALHLVVGRTAAS